MDYGTICGEHRYNQGEYMTREIILTKGQVVVIDDSDYPLVSQYKWYAMWVKNRYYACGYYRPAKGVYKTRLLHRFLMDAKSGQQIDHVNGNTLDCRRCNLRFATDSENQRNRGKHRDNSSGYKGVDWMPQKQKWRARICVNRNEIHLGLFDSPVDAAKVYDEAALKYHGRFARTNF